MSYNNVVLMGNLTRDPELRTLPSGTPVAKIAMAMDRKWRDKNDELQKETTFIDIESFGKVAEIVSKYLRKGEPVLVGGRLRYSTWESKDGSGKRSKVDVVAENVQLLPRRSGGGAPGFGPGPSDPVFPGEFRADAATAFEDAEDSEEALDDAFGGAMPNDRR